MVSLVGLRSQLELCRLTTRDKSSGGRFTKLSRDLTLRGTEIDVFVGARVRSGVDGSVLAWGWSLSGGRGIAL